jgi:hypothetical protein
MARASFLGFSPADVAARVGAVASEAAGGPVVVRVGDEVFGCCNVGVDLAPTRRRRPAAAGRALRRRVLDALERAGVVLAELAIAPRVAGELRGSVRVRESVPSQGDAAHMLRAPRRV